MKRFDTNVQYLKYMALREVAKHAFNGDLAQNVIDIPKAILPGSKPTMRCCIYKERAIMGERVKLAMGGNKSDPNIIEVLDIACDECPAGGFEVTDNCRGCIAHRCAEACARDAITFDQNQKAHIDKTKCIECGRCAKVCPYTAIISRKRPCQNACKVKAISMDEDLTAKINDEKCIACGACVYQCPFGAISDKSFILDTIDIIKNSKGNSEYKVYAVVAPSISSQFKYAKLGQVVTGIKQLGFFSVVEAALGADMVADEECHELHERGLLTSSCCPSFVAYINNEFPQLKEHVSTALSPMAAIGKYIKSSDKSAKVVFIGPCTSKKAEFQKPEVRPYIDSVITFEELQALFDSKDLDIASAAEDVLDNASYYGRIFARSGGLADAVKQALKENNLPTEDYRPVACNGIDECKLALLKAKVGKLDANFIEGMACQGGCIGGAGCLTHGDKDSTQVDAYGMEAMEKTIKDSLKVLPK